MTLRSLAPAFIFVLALSSPWVPAWAAAPGGCDLALSGGIGLPTGDFGDENLMDARTGPQIGIEFDYDVAEAFAVGVDASWNRNKHGAEGSVEDLGGGITLTADKDRFTTLQFGAHGRYKVPLGGPVTIYGLLGLGVYNLKEDYEYTYDDGVTQTVFTDESDDFEQPGSRLGGRLGAGATYMASPTVGIGVGFDFNHVAMDKDKFGVSSVQYLSVRGRLVYHFASK